MSGLRSSFSRPRRKYGATANIADGGETPSNRTLFTPPVSGLDRPSITSMPDRANHFTQDAAQLHQPASPASAKKSITTRGGHGNSANALRRSSTGKLNFPVPCHTLRARLSLASYEANKVRTQHRKYPDDMKSVDRTAIQFRMRFHGRPGEDWMGHVDALEIHRANKFQWTPRQFYYGLLQTLRAVALMTANSLEEELVEIDLLVYMPGWFQAEMTELRSIISGETTYPQLEPRTKLAILFSYFEDRFQRDSADQAITNFRFATQFAQESIEEWGMRITRLQKRVEKHGMTVPFKMFLNKWKTDTSSTFFTAKLRDALWPADFNREPIITDRYTFKAWMQRYLRQQRERGKDKAEHNRISLIERYRVMADQKAARTPSPRLRKTTLRTPVADKDRKGPAPRVTTNVHNKLFSESGPRSHGPLICQGLPTT